MKITQPSIPPVNSVGTDQLQNGAVTSPKLDPTLYADIALLDAANAFTGTNKFTVPASDQLMRWITNAGFGQQTEWQWRLSNLQVEFTVGNVGGGYSDFLTFKTNGVNSPLSLTFGMQQLIAGNLTWHINTGGTWTFENGTLDLSTLAALTLAANQIDGSALKDGTVTAAKLAVGIGVVYSGYWSAGGVAPQSLPSGWTLTVIATGRLTLAHNLNLATPETFNIVLQAIGTAQRVYFQLTNYTANDVEVQTHLNTDGSLVDQAAQFIAKVAV